MCQKYLLTPKGSEIPLSHYYVGGNMLKKWRPAWQHTAQRSLEDTQRRLVSLEAKYKGAILGKFSTLLGRPPQSGFWTLIVLLQTGAAYISCFKCFQMLAFVPWGENGRVSTNTLIGATILFPGHPYILAMLPQAHNSNQS